jgi:bifunctional non-homologous end joining protein LigD
MLARSAAIRSTTLPVGLCATFGTALTKRYRRTLKALLNLRVQSIVLDGEVPRIDADGRSDFVLHSRLNDAWVPLCAFDLLELNGEDYRERPLLERKQS